MKKNNYKQDILKLTKDIQKIKQKLAIIDFEKKIEEEKIHMGYFWSFLLLTPINIIGYTIYGIYRAIVKPFELMYLTKEEKKHYECSKDLFSEFEYMWGSINKKHKD